MSITYNKMFTCLAAMTEYNGVKLNPAMKMVYSYLYGFHANNKPIYPSNRTIAKACGLSLTTACACTKALEKAGIIKGTIGSNNHKSYSILVDEYALNDYYIKTIEKEKEDEATISTECINEEEETPVNEESIVDVIGSDEVIQDTASTTTNLFTDTYEDEEDVSMSMQRIDWGTPEVGTPTVSMFC